MDKEQNIKDNENEVIMLPLSEVASIKWTPERGRNLQRLRGEMPMLELARRVENNGYKVSRQYLQKLESDPSVKGVCPKMLKAVCKSLGITMSEILGLPSRNFSHLGG